jgi:Ca2+-binding RTX toxin-like protein
MRIPHGLLIGALVLTPVLVAMPAEAAAGSCAGKTALIRGTGGDDTVTGTPLSDVVWLGGGDDEYTDLGGNDVICGGGGNDHIDGGGGDDFVDGGAGDDEISGGPDDDRIQGGAGKDAITPGAGNDVVRADKGDDYVAEGAGDDKINGGPGTDYLTYLFWDGSIRVRAGQVIDGAGHDVAATVETLEGTSRADVLRGSARVDDLRGGGGRDQIYGQGGNDILFVHGGTARGGAGTDYIQASGRSVALGGPESDEIALGAGPVRASGGPEPDSFRLISVKSTATINGDGGPNQLNLSTHKRAVRVDVGAGRTTWKGGSLRLRNIDNVLGTVRNDVLIGSTGNDYMDGFRGGDTLRGRGGNDFLVGKGGYDKADGGPGWDICLAENTTACP